MLDLKTNGSYFDTWIIDDGVRRHLLHESCGDEARARLVLNRIREELVASYNLGHKHGRAKQVKNCPYGEEAALLAKAAPAPDDT